METFLIVQRGEDIGRRYDLDTTQLTIGRGSDNDMVLNDPMVSRYHAVVKRHGSRYTMIDLGSSNPVLINDQAIDPGTPQQLQHRDVVFIGKTVFSFQSRSTPEQSQGQRQEQTPPPSGRMDQTMIRPGSGPLPAPPPRPDAAATQIAPERPASPPITPTMEAPLPPRPQGGGSGNEKTIVAPAADESAASDNERTAVGTVRVGDMPDRPTPPPAPNFPPPPPLGAPPAPGKDRLIGTPPDDEDTDMPTQIVPRR